MKNINYADFNNKENDQENTNTLSKSADMLSARDLILSLNDSLINKKSKEYNFDFNSAASYDTNETFSNMNFSRNKPCLSKSFSQNANELQLIARKTKSNLVNEADCKASSADSSLKDFTSSNTTGNNHASNNIQSKSKQIFGNFGRNSNIEAIKKLKERLQILQQQKKKFEFFEAKQQTQESIREIEVDDKPNVFFE